MMTKYRKVSEKKGSTINLLAIKTLWSFLMVLRQNFNDESQSGGERSS
jgi:hypothetical protein